MRAAWFVFTIIVCTGAATLRMTTGTQPGFETALVFLYGLVVAFSACALIEDRA